MGMEFLLEMKNRGDSCTRLNALNTTELQHLRMVKTANVTLLYYSKKKKLYKTFYTVVQHPHAQDDSQDAICTLVQGPDILHPYFS